MEQKIPDIDADLCTTLRVKPTKLVNAVHRYVERKGGAFNGQYALRRKTCRHPVGSYNYYFYKRVEDILKCAS